MKIYEWSLQALLSSAPCGFAARSPVLAQLASLAQIRELARRKGNNYPEKSARHAGKMEISSFGRRRVILDQIKKTQTTSKTFLEKRVSMELITMTLLWTLEISIIKKNHLRMKLLCKKINSHTCLYIFPVYGTTLTEEDIASCSRTLRKHKNPEEERKFIENGTPKSKTSLWKYCLKPAGVQRLDTAEANLTTESLNF